MQWGLTWTGGEMTGVSSETMVCPALLWQRITEVITYNILLDRPPLRTTGGTALSSVNHFKHNRLRISLLEWGGSVWDSNLIYHKTKYMKVMQSESRTLMQGEVRGTGAEQSLQRMKDWLLHMRLFFRDMQVQKTNTVVLHKITNEYV